MLILNQWLKYCFHGSWAVGCLTRWLWWNRILISLMILWTYAHFMRVLDITDQQANACSPLAL